MLRLRPPDDSAKKILVITAVLLAVAAIVYFVVPPVLFGFFIAQSARYQMAKIERARPRFNSLVAQKLHVGDSLVHIEKVLTDAGVWKIDIDREASPPEVRSVYLADGPGPGFLIELQLDSRDRVSKINIQEDIAEP